MIKIDDFPHYFEKNKLENEEWEIGVDEAGRGPVLGPMVYGLCFWPVSLKSKLANIGFNDSKKLKEQERDEFFEIIKKLSNHCLGYEVQILSAEYLSNRMLEKEKYDLNKISHESAMTLIEIVLKKGINVVHSYLDTVGKPETYQEILKKRFSGAYPNLKFTVSEKADSKYPVVSAASICAKVTRDQSIKGWKCRENIDGIVSMDYGSGYPSDEKTQNWLKKNVDPVFGFVDLVRFSWKTCEIIIKQNIKIDFENEAEKQEGNMKLNNFVRKEKRGAFTTRIGVTNDFSL